MVQPYEDSGTLTDLRPDESTQRYEEARAAAHRAMTNVRLVPDPPEAEPEFGTERPAYRGFKAGAAFFGWLIALSMTVFFVLVVAGLGGVAGYVLDFTAADARRRPTEVALAAAIGVTVVLSLAYFCGGYVAGRLARFDGKRQGVGVWLITVLVGVFVAGIGAALNVWYDAVGRLDRSDLPLRVGTLDPDLLRYGALATAGAIVLLTLVCAILGGGAGRRFHDKIDRELD
ncbi:hypothetical protein [Kribbella sp. ALI-6-A]|uniref:hypothetical protein n=1 Tax=Kribbella sp. ALI-6-A TaxID=1933817 RepID=UPI00117AA868|nr:hypothetical protein [Kribbella sp. ALI-6-A]